MRNEESAKRPTSSLPGKNCSTTSLNSAKSSRNADGHRWDESTTPVNANSA
uniref:Candidate secreted effector n=1 Tax=Meloidogyne incognita TaxID=6306 RepID=A0A914MFE0_MELIC